MKSWIAMDLPDEYVRYLETGGVVEAPTESEPGYIALWPLAEIEQNNRDLQVAEYAPGFLGFGGDGGGEMLAFDRDGIVYMLPMIGMEPLLIHGSSWSSELISRNLPARNLLV